MDIVTHAMMGAVVASPVAAEHPEAAAAFLLGSALPDLDALSRLFGKRAFLAAHQTWSHALPVIAATGGLAALAGPGIGLGLALGMCFHSLLDVTNTYGIALLAPFSRRRYCTEWIFFIDAIVVAATLATLGWIAWRAQAHGDPGRAPALAYSVAMAAYWGLRIALRRRALRACPEGTLALLPSALWPRRWYGCARRGDVVETFRVGPGGVLDGRKTWELHDASFPQVLALPEFRRMRIVSPAYHAVGVERSGDRTTVTCRDLRTRNFGGNFGLLEVVLDAGGSVVEKRFHV